MLPNGLVFVTLSENGVDNDQFVFCTYTEEEVTVVISFTKRGCFQVVLYLLTKLCSAHILIRRIPLEEPHAFQWCYPRAHSHAQPLH